MAGRATVVLGGLLAAGLVAGVTIAAGKLGSDAPLPTRDGPPNAPVHAGTDAASEVVDTGTEGTTERGVFVMWARGGLTEDIAARAAELPDVVATAFVRSDTLGLVGSRDADGVTVDQLSDGFRIPVTVAAVAPDAYASTLIAPEAGEAVASLRPGEVLLSETAAEMRGIGDGGELDLVGRPGLRVVGILTDGTVRRAEVVVHVADADALGLAPDGSLVVRHTAAPGGRTAEVAAALEALAPDGVPTRVVEVGAEGGRHVAPLVLSLMEIKHRFGEFAYRPRAGAREIDVERAFLDEHIVTVNVPILGGVRCHREIVEDLRAALTEIVDEGLAATIDPRRYGGCHHPRRISVSRDRLSSHSWGIAIDLNVDLSLPGLGPVPPGEVIEIFGRHGFRWGGDFIQPDNHHFEWVGPEAVHRPDR